jgi:pimeloyl-ACP methyl ester carboxylesterase
LAGVGDSSLPPGRSGHHAYGLDAVADVAAAVSHLEGCGIERPFVGGLCSGAYLAWHAAAEIQDLGGLIMLNLQLFEWTEGLSFDVSPLDLQYKAKHYRKSARSARSWRKLLRGEVDVGRSVGIGVRFFRYEVGAFAQRIRTALPILGTGSEIPDRIQELEENGTTVVFIFADRDPGLTMLRKKIGGAWKGLIEKDQMRVDIVEGADHSFTPGWASRQVYEAIEQTLVD